MSDHTTTDELIRNALAALAVIALATGFPEKFRAPF